MFLPAKVTGNHGDEPISIKKLQQGDGLWDTRKEILGWLFDGIQLPEAKVESLLTELHQTARCKSMNYKQFEKLHGKLWHACIGIPAGRSLMGPIDNALMRANRKPVDIVKNQLLRDTLSDFHTLIRMMS